MDLQEAVFAHRDAIAILTLVAYAQLLTLAGPSA
jgi:hypothetical protein